MSQVRRVGSGFIQAIDCADGSVVNPDENGYCTLTAGHTYVYILGGAADATLESVQFLTDGVIVFNTSTTTGGLVFESSNLPKHKGDPSSSDATAYTDYDNSNSYWTQENPNTALIGTSGTGWTVTSAVLTKTAGVGSAMVHIGNLGCKRLRAKVLVVTSGKLATCGHGKY